METTVGTCQQTIAHYSRIGIVRQHIDLIAIKYGVHADYHNFIGLGTRPFVLYVEANAETANEIRKFLNQRQEIR